MGIDMAKIQEMETEAALRKEINQLWLVIQIMGDLLYCQDNNYNPDEWIAYAKKQAEVKNV